MIEQIYLIHRWDPNRVDLGVIAMKGYSPSSKTLGLEPHNQMQYSVIPKTHVEEVLHVCRDAVGIFYSPN